MLHPVVMQLGLTLIKVVCLLVAIAYYTIAERKIMAAIQRRRGPNVVGFWGLLQPLADGLKLIAKEMVIPSHSNSRIFVIAPLCILTLGLLNWSILPFGSFDYSEYASTQEIITSGISFVEMKEAISFNFLVESNDVSDVRYGLLVILALSSLSVYGLILAGWASNSKYAFLGALRSAAQMISYEVSISLVLIPVIFLSGSLNFTEIISTQINTIWYVVPLFPLAIIFFISIIAETNRTPFDLPEAEAELVAGYNVEYSSIIFAMFFLAEYSNMIMMSFIKSNLFIGGWEGLDSLPSAMSVTLKALVFCFLFVLVRATFPRYRYDQLMDIGWKIFLPITTGLLLLYVGLLMSYGVTPVVALLEFAAYFEPRFAGFKFVWGWGGWWGMPSIGWEPYRAPLSPLELYDKNMRSILAPGQHRPKFVPLTALDQRRNFESTHNSYFKLQMAQFEARQYEIKKLAQIEAAKQYEIKKEVEWVRQSESRKKNQRRIVTVLEWVMPPLNLFAKVAGFVSGKSGPGPQ